MSDLEKGKEQSWKKKFDPGAVIVIILSLIVITYVVVRNKGLTENAVYTKGVVIDINKGARGNVQLNFYFFINGKQYKSFVSAKFCNECKTPCCHSGDSVIVRYQRNHPDNNDLLHGLPKDAILTY